jgi:g-D-glutamyl-meso-diaminopimelate peptidase
VKVHLTKTSWKLGLAIFYSIPIVSGATIIATPHLANVSTTSQVSIQYNEKKNTYTRGLYNKTEYLPLDTFVNLFHSLGIPNFINFNMWNFSKLGSGTISIGHNRLIIVSIPHQSSMLVPTEYADNITFVPLNAMATILNYYGYQVQWNSPVLRIQLPTHNQPSINPHLVVNPHQVYTYVTMEKDLTTLSKMYPNLIHLQIEGQTNYGRNLYAVSLGTGKAVALIVAAHHAREWITSNLAMNMLDTYAFDATKNISLNGYNVANVLKKTTIWFMPMVNPDGVTLAQLGDKAFPAFLRPSLIEMNNGSTDFTDWKANAQGIDPNRQYPAGWKTMPRIVNRPWFACYQGTKPFEINEVKSVVKLVNTIQPEDMITYHASGDQIYWGYHVTPQKNPAFYQFALGFQHLTGYPVMMPSLIQQGGGMTDWWTYDLKKPGLTIEVGPAEGTHPVPLPYYSQIWSQNQADGLLLATDAYQLLQKKPTP